nr:2-ketogluconate transporter [Colletotrichum truncatum]KAF6800516.1 2-ketogluconate transporter [Colletotrichum truncatum]
MKQDTTQHQSDSAIAPVPSEVPAEHQEGDKETNKWAGTISTYIDEKTNKELFWIVNRRILACMLGTYFCQSLDKGTLGFASVMNIREDANLVGQQFRTAMWYTKREQSILTSLWYCMTGVQLMVGGIIAWGASHYVGHDIKSWQLLFLVLGAATCVWGLFIGWWLPDSPMAAKCFNEDQKRLMIERVRANETGIQNKTYKRYQMIEAITDPVVWCYIMLQVTSTLIIGGLGVFSNLIIASFGFTYLQTQLLNIAQGAVTIIVMVGSASLATWTKQTAWVMHAWTIPAIIGTAVIYSIPPSPTNRIGLLIAFYCTQFYLAEGNLIFSLISRNIAGQTKKSTTLAMTFIGWAAGNMTAPQIFQSSDAPRYRKGFTAHFCLYVLFNLFLALMRFLLIRRNISKRKAAVAADPSGLAAEEISEDDKAASAGVRGSDEKIEHSNAFADLTDKENPDFRYDF